MMRPWTILAISMFLTAGSCPPRTEIVVEKALFCDVEEKRVFSQEEIDWRADNAAWNLARDFRTNIAWERENCDDPEDE